MTRSKANETITGLDYAEGYDSEEAKKARDLLDKQAAKISARLDENIVLKTFQSRIHEAKEASKSKTLPKRK